MISICVLYICSVLHPVSLYDFEIVIFICRFYHSSLYKEAILLMDSGHRSDTITQCRTTWPINMNISAGVVLWSRNTARFTLQISSNFINRDRKASLLQSASGSFLLAMESGGFYKNQRPMWDKNLKQVLWITGHWFPLMDMISYNIIDDVMTIGCFVI